MKTYVITLSQVFPTTHPKAGIPTGFQHKLQTALNGWKDHSFTKLHTIRANYPLWAKRFEQIERGEACLSIRQWSGKPYASKQVEIARLTKEDGIGLQKFEVCNNHAGINLWMHFKIDDRPIMSINDIPNNDGLSREDWVDWFKKYDLSKPMAIIHFTKFRY
ncbi:MAG: hypothetical protein UH084_08295 [Paludibacteraceae bacterium]|nr:hypothetical protein [Paludibacteraceae bacterium]